MKDDAPYGASAVDGKLFFKLLDGSSVSCNCIGEPFVSEVAKACQYSPHKAILDKIGENPDTRRELLVLLKRAAPRLDIPEIATPSRRWWQWRHA